MNVTTATRKELERRRDRTYKILQTGRHDTRYALRLQSTYDKCVNEIVKRDLNAMTTTR